MVYFFKKNLWADGNQTLIVNAAGKTLMRLEKKTYSMTNRMIVLDRYQVEIGHYERSKFLTGWLYDIVYEGQKIAQVRYKRGFFSKGYKLDVQGITYGINGDFKSGEFRIQRLGITRAHVSARYTDKQGWLGMKTNDEEKQFVFLSAALIMSTS